MSKLSKIQMGTPIGKDLILYWEKSGHIERGRLEFNDDNHLYHVLSLDGERLNDEPTHYMEIPDVES